MSKKRSGLFTGTKGSLSGIKERENGPKAEENTEPNFNSAGSKDVKLVNEVNVLDKASHPKMPTKGMPNSVTKLIHDGKVDQERYYDENGDVYLDIDYTNHNNPKTHPVVPHQHKWRKKESGEIERLKWEEINHE